MVQGQEDLPLIKPQVGELWKPYIKSSTWDHYVKAWFGSLMWIFGKAIFVRQKGDILINTLTNDSAIACNLYDFSQT